MKKIFDTGQPWLLLLCLTAALFALSGCAAPKPAAPTAEEAMKAGILDGAIAAAKAPLFKLTCPVTGCILGSLEVGNPAGAGQMAEVVKVAMTPQPSEASQNFRAVVGVLGQVGGYGVIGAAASNITGKLIGGYTAGFSSNTAIAGAGFDAAGKVATLIPQVPVAVPPALPTTSIVVSGSGPTNIGSGSLLNSSQNPTNPVPKVCVAVPATATTPASMNCT